MRLLFAITIGCFCVLMWVALALARRIRLAQLLQARPVRPVSTPREFFEAGEFRTPRPMHLEQEILQQKPRRPLSEITFSPGLAAPAIPASTPEPDKLKVDGPDPAPSRPSAATYATLFGESIAIAHIGSHAQPTAHDAVQSSLTNESLHPAPVKPALAFTLHRKQPPVARQSGLRRRLDFSQYNNKDMGDLTDPYTHQMRAFGAQGPALTNRTGG